MKAHKKVQSNFLKVVCEKCKNEQNIFEKPSRQIPCLVCGEILAESTGGKAKLVRAKKQGEEK